MVVYDVTDRQSFQSCAKWLERVKAQKAAVELKLPGGWVYHYGNGLKVPPTRGPDC